jgi:anti-anti-sigma regulatory factor
VQLGELLTIEQVAAMHAELGRHLHAGAVVLEAGAVKRIDTAGLQLLAALVRAAESRGKPVQWRSVSAAVRDGARHVGLSAALGLG